MRQSITLVILAAGIGSRYGGNKQLDAFGPNGESLMEYALYDAKKAGFTNILFIIRHEIEALLVEKIIRPYQGWFGMDYVCQEIDSLPEGVKAPAARKKPWGTGHAILLCSEKVRQPFAVVNADDFYGTGSYQKMAEALFAVDPSTSEFFINGFRLKNTLSENGTVSRGMIGEQDGWMSSLVEHTKIAEKDGKILNDAEASATELSPDQPVSMNFWGFTPAVFPILKAGFEEFLSNRLDEAGAEYYITTPINQAIQSKKIKVKLLDCQEHWLGVTHKEDQKQVILCLKQKHGQGLYPKQLAPA